MPPTPSRRALLRTGVGLATIGTTAYAGAHLVSKTGTVVIRHVSGQEREGNALSNTVDIAHAELNSDGTVDRDVHTDYRNLLDPNAKCSTPAVNRENFNNSHLGETVELVYHGSTATVVPF